MAYVPEENQNRSWIKKKKMQYNAIGTVDHEILLQIFSFLHLFDVVRSTAVCKSWNRIIHSSNIMESLYRIHISPSKGISDSNLSKESFNKILEMTAMAQHDASLVSKRIHVYQWEGHSKGVSKCRMKNGLIVTGVGDKVMRLWSARSRKCLEEYSLPHMPSPIDFDFDESKIVSLYSTQICIWRRGDSKPFVSHETLFPNSKCMCYSDPDVIVGCDDGTARFFDMYSKKCSQIISTQSGALTCVAVGDYDQMIVSGSACGILTVADFRGDRVTTKLRSTIYTGGVKSLRLDRDSISVLCGSTSGYVTLWDLRKMESIWESRVSPNTVMSVGSGSGFGSWTVVAAGIDGVIRVLDRRTGEVTTGCVMEEGHGKWRGRGVRVGNVMGRPHPPITCVAVGMEKVVTTHGSSLVRLWHFGP